MSSTEQTKSGDDNIITRRKHVKESLNVIRDKKERLRTALKTVSEAETPDKEMMAKLLEAFDMMTAQENQYLEVMKNIVEIHELAVDDVAKEIEEQKQVEVQESKEDDKEKSEEIKGEPASEQELNELEATLRELQEVSAAAAAASKLNEQLVHRLQLHKNKKTTLNEIRKEKTAEMRQKANEALTEVEIAKMKLTAEKGAYGRKEKQLERLRKEALKRGIKLGSEEQKEKEEMMKEVEKSGERIPPLKTEEETKEEEEEEKNEEQLLEERRKEIRENVRREKEKKEQINQQIRERLKAMEARKDRVRQLRLLLTQSAESPESAEMTKQVLDDTFANAAANLANLTAMRERLEAMHAQQQTQNAEELPSEANDEVAEAVRHRFTTAMEKTAASDQLNRIESLLLEQRGMLQKVTATPSVHSLSQRLSLSSSSVLRRLSSLLLQIADNRGSNRPAFIPHLDVVLSEVFQSEESPEEFQRPPSPENSQVIIDQQDSEGRTDAIEQLLDELRKEVRNTSTVDEQTAERFRSLTVAQMSSLFPTVSSEVFDSQLGAQVQDFVGQYVGIGVDLCEDNLLFEVAELLKNELSYYQLMNSLNTISDS